MAKAKRKCNTTPCLSVKNPTSQGTFAEMSAIGGTTARARVEGGKQRGDVAWRNGQGRRNRGIRPNDGGSRVWSGDNYRDVIVRCVWETNRRNGLSSLSDSRRCKWKGWDRW